MSKSDTVLFMPHCSIRISTTAIDGGVRISINGTLTLNKFYIQYLNHTFFGVLEFSWNGYLEYVKKI